METFKRELLLISIGENIHALPAMRGHGEIFSVKCLRNLGSRLVQPSMGMVIEAKIAR